MRDALLTKKYFDQRIQSDTAEIERQKHLLATGEDTVAAKGFVIRANDLASKTLRVLISRYSRGDDLAELRPAMLDMIAAWQELRKRLDALPPEEQPYRTQYEKLNFDNYSRFFWRLAFAVLLGADKEHLAQVVRLIGNEEEDALLDRVIAKLQPGRKIGTKVLFPRPYQPLYDSLDAVRETQPKLVARFLKGWYEGSKKAFWYNNGKDDNSGYFGYWCFEAALVVVLFDIDDSSFRDHPNYPKELADEGRKIRAGR